MRLFLVLNIKPPVMISLMKLIVNKHWAFKPCQALLCALYIPSGFLCKWTVAITKHEQVQIDFDKPSKPQLSPYTKPEVRMTVTIISQRKILKQRWQAWRQLRFKRTQVIFLRPACCPELPLESHETR